MLKVIIIIVVILALILFGFSLWMAGYIMAMGIRQTLQEAMDWQKAHYDVSFYEGLEKTDYTVEGHEGYILHVQFLKNPTPTDKYMILTHGYTDNRNGCLKYVKMYLDLGYNCIIYDIRGHGLNEKACTTYGILEAKDLIKLIEDTRSRYGNIARLGLHGESLGSGTTITALKYKPQVDFVVEDCGFSDIENVLRKAYRDIGAPEFVFDIANFGAKVRYHMALKDMRPIDSLDDNNIPILFIHGGNDELIVPRNAQDMYDRTRGKKDIHIIEGAPHAESILTDPEGYRTYVESYLNGLD